MFDTSKNKGTKMAGIKKGCPFETAFLSKRSFLRRFNSIYRTNIRT